MKRAFKFLKNLKKILQIKTKEFDLTSKQFTVYDLKNKLSIF